MDTAAARRGLDSHCMAPWMMGYWMPKSSVIRVSWKCLLFLVWNAFMVTTSLEEVKPRNLLRDTSQGKGEKKKEIWGKRQEQT